MSLDRREFLQTAAGVAAAGALGLNLDGGAFAKAPLATAQAPAYYRFKVDNVEITTISDGLLDLPLSLFPAADKAQAEEILAKAHRPEKAPTAVKTYVINTGDKLILVDTGYGNMAGPTAGMLLDNLKAAGLEPSQFDAVVITHLHPDHAGGLLDQKGQPVFQNAMLLVGEKEHAFWTDEGIASRAPAEAQKFFKIAQAAIKPYEKRTQLYKDGEQIAPGVTAIAAPGHTPGHSMVRVGTGKNPFLIWGDVVHVGALQFPRPEWAIAFDTDQAQAIETRKKVFNQAASDGILIGGMHLDFPGAGYVAREAQGFSYQRAVWSPKI